VDICPLCKGEGKRIVVITHKISGLKKTAVEWCLCKQSQFASADPNLGLLSWLQDQYLPYEEIDPQLKFNRNALSKSPNYLIAGTSFGSFCLHLKGVVMQQRALEPPPLIYAGRAIDVLHDFYVQQLDGTSPRLSETQKFDLMVFTLDTAEKNDKLKTVISQVVYTRKTTQKPTWIFLPYATLGQCTQEFSPELEQLLAPPADEKLRTPQHYLTVTLAEKGGQIGVRETESKKAAIKFEVTR